MRRLGEKEISKRTSSTGARTPGSGPSGASGLPEGSPRAVAWRRTTSCRPPVIASTTRLLERWRPASSTLFAASTCLCPCRRTTGPGCHRGARAAAPRGSAGARRGGARGGDVRVGSDMRELRGARERGGGAPGRVRRGPCPRPAGPRGAPSARRRRPASSTASCTSSRGSRRRRACARGNIILPPRDARRGRAGRRAARDAGALVEVDRAGRAAELHHDACGGARRRRRGFGAAGRRGAPGGSLAPAASAMMKICAVCICCVEAGGTDMEALDASMKERQQRI